MHLIIGKCHSRNGPGTESKLSGDGRPALCNENKGDDGEQQGYHPYQLLHTAALALLPLVIAVPETALQIGARDVFLVFSFKTAVNLAELLAELVLFLVIITRLIIEDPVFGRTEKSEIESHTK